MASVAVCVDPAEVPKVWERAKGFIKAAIDRIGISNFDDVTDDVLCGSSLLWLAWDGQKIVGAGVTEINERVCTIVAYGGKRQDHLLEQIENYARAERCRTVRVVGRKGWVRVLKRYHQPFVVLERHL